MGFFVKETVVGGHCTVSPFGEVLSASGPQAASNPWRFSTKYFDPDTGLGYWGYRWYDATRGRWLSRDLIGENGGENLYGYCGNDGVVTIDPVGLTASRKELLDGLVSLFSSGSDLRLSQVGEALRIIGADKRADDLFTKIARPMREKSIDLVKESLWKATKEAADIAALLASSVGASAKLTTALSLAKFGAEVAENSDNTGKAFLKFAIGKLTPRAVERLLGDKYPHLQNVVAAGSKKAGSLAIDKTYDLVTASKLVSGVTSYHFPQWEQRYASLSDWFWGEKTWVDRGTEGSIIYNDHTDVVLAVLYCKSTPFDYSGCKKRLIPVYGIYDEDATLINQRGMYRPDHPTGSLDASMEFPPYRTPELIYWAP